MSFKMVAGITGAIIAVAIAIPTIGMLASVATAPQRVISKTLQTDNIINSYEWFHDAHGQYKSRVAQIKQYAQLLSSETERAERSRLNIEVSAIRQSCRDLATRYNANATKSNRSIFMGKEVPEELSMQECDR